MVAVLDLWRGLLTPGAICRVVAIARQGWMYHLIVLFATTVCTDPTTADVRGPSGLGQCIDCSLFITIYFSVCKKDTSDDIWMWNWHWYDNSDRRLPLNRYRCHKLLSNGTTNVDLTSPSNPTKECHQNVRSRHMDAIVCRTCHFTS